MDFAWGQGAVRALAIHTSDSAPVRTVRFVEDGRVLYTMPVKPGMSVKVM